MSIPADYQKILAQIEKLQAKAEKAKAKEREEVLVTIVQNMIHYDISVTDVEKAVGAIRRENENAVDSTNQLTSSLFSKSLFARNQGKRQSRRKAEVKYRDSKTGNTWTGRGKLPAWLREAEKSGQSRDLFLVRK